MITIQLVKIFKNLDQKSILQLLVTKYSDGTHLVPLTVCHINTIISRGNGQRVKERALRGTEIKFMVKFTKCFWIV